MILRVQSVVLAAALVASPYSVSVVNAQTGCYPGYVSGAPYTAGEWVSADVDETETCSSGDAGCVDGSRIVTKTYNYQCRDGPSSQFCANSGFSPGGIYSDSAWDVEGTECTGTATAPTEPVPDPWSTSDGGCPPAYSTGTSYEAGDYASVDFGTFSMVYECASEPNNLFCGQTGYEPGDSINWGVAWTAAGSCSGSLSPTTSPNYVSIADAGGCPGEYTTGSAYEEGDRVAASGLVFQCKAWPSGAHCGQAGYEPLGGGGTPDAWKDAWDVVGYCSGTIAPSSSPSYADLVDMGGCPDEWETISYEEGDTISSNGLVFSCKAWPSGAHCGQAGYEPLVDSATPDAWNVAWVIMGYCAGTIGPTTSPTFDAADSVGACPDEWEAGDNVKYEEGDMVSVTVSTDPLREFAYTCKSWPMSGHCGQYSPLMNLGSQGGWEMAGSCDGSLGPTSSPTFDDLVIDPAGCPEEYSTAMTDFEAGDRVAVTLSTAPERKIVFQCRTWPNSGYCNQAAFAPGTSEHTDMAWTIIGACTGSFAPTIAPVAYVGTCEYDKCIMVESTETNCVPGSAGCSCLAGYPASASCTRVIETETCNPANVDPYSTTVDYVTDDVVRVGTMRFKCREWPNFLWCRNAAYRPQVEEGIWSEAWRTDGECPP